MNISMKQKQTHRHREQMCGCQGEGGWQREGLGVGISRRKLVYVGWIYDKVLLYDTGNYIQYAVMNQNGKGYVKEYIYVYMHMYVCIYIAIVQSLTHVQLFATPWTAACQASLSFTISYSLLKLISIESVMPSNHLTLCCPLLLLPSIFPSIDVFSNESVLPIKWPKYWSFSFSISPSSEYAGLISFMIDWFDLLAIQQTLESILQHHNLKVSVLQYSAFLMVQVLHPYMTTGITISLTIWTFVGKLMSLLLIFCLGLS